MDNNQQLQNKKQVNGYLAIVGGLVIFVLGFLLDKVPVFTDYLKLFQGIGFFLILYGVFLITQVFIYKKNPKAMRKDMVESLDERKVLIRYRSGNNAFFFANATTYLALLIVGMTKAPINPDIAWWVLATIVSLTLVVYVGFLIYYENKY